MRRLFLQRFCLHAVVGVMAGLFLMCPMASAQSLGEVARELQQEKAAEAPATPSKVITNKDLQEDADEEASPSPEKTPAQICRRAQISLKRGSSRGMRAIRMTDRRSPGIRRTSLIN